MDQLGAEHILFHWDEASEDARRAAARYGVSELDAALARLEAEVPAIAGLASVWALPAAIRGGYRCSAAVLSWTRTYPDLADEWKALGRRAQAVLSALAALGPSGRWSPPLTGNQHLE